MRIDVTDYKTKFLGLSLALTQSDIDALIRKLAELRAVGDQHFHLSTNADEGSVYVDIEISMQAGIEPSNAFGSGFAIDPSDTA